MTEAGWLAALEARGIGLPTLFQEFGRQVGPPPPGEPWRPLASPGVGAGVSDAGGNLPPRPIDSIDAFKDRVAVYDLQGKPRLGRPLASITGATVARPVHNGDTVVAMLLMRKLKPVPNEVELHFLNTQYQSIAGVACVLLVIAWGGALWMSRHWVGPLIAVQDTTEKIAKGQFETRLQTRRSDEFGDTMRNIDQMAAALQKLEGARRQWIADMSHELRTPLTVLRGEIEALIDGVIALTPGALLSLREEVLQLNALVDDLHLLAMADLNSLPC